MDKTYSVQFFRCLVEAVQKCSHDYLKFEKSVELGGFLFLEIDGYKKERYVLNEMIHNNSEVISESYCVRSFDCKKRLATKSSNLNKVSSDISSGSPASLSETIDPSIECSMPLTNNSNPVSTSLRQWKSLKNKKEHSQVSPFVEQITSVSQASTSLSYSTNIQSPRIERRLSDVQVHDVNNESEVGNSVETSSTYIIYPAMKGKPKRCVLKNFSVPSSQSLLVNSNNKTSNTSFDQIDTEMDITSLENKPEHESTGQKCPTVVHHDSGLKDVPDIDAELMSSSVAESDAKTKNIYTDSEARLSSAEVVPYTLHSITEPSGPSTSDSVRLPLPQVVDIKEELVDIKEEYDLNDVVCLVDSQGSCSNSTPTVTNMNPHITSALRSNRKLLKKNPPKTQRYRPSMDIILLREYLKLQPFMCSNPKSKQEAWEKIVLAINHFINGGNSCQQVYVTERASRDRVKTLIETFKKDDMASLKASGTEEEYSERDALLTDLCLVLEGKEASKYENYVDVKEPEKRKLFDGEEVYTTQMLNLKDNGPSSAKKKTPIVNQDYVAYLKHKADGEMQLRKQEIDLAKERFQLEKQEAEARREKDRIMLELLIKNMTHGT